MATKPFPSDLLVCMVRVVKWEVQWPLSKTGLRW